MKKPEPARPKSTKKGKKSPKKGSKSPKSPKIKKGKSKRKKGSKSPRNESTIIRKKVTGDEVIKLAL